MKQIFHLKCLGFLVALLFSTLASGSEWKLVVDAGYLIYDVDQETISREKSVVTFWSRSTVRHGEAYFAKYAPNETPYATQKIHHKIDCSKRTHTILEGATYNDAGQSVSSFYEPSPEVAIVPDSTAENYLKAVCPKPTKKR